MNALEPGPWPIYKENFMATNLYCTASKSIYQNLIQAKFLTLGAQVLTPVLKQVQGMNPNGSSGGIWFQFPKTLAIPSVGTKLILTLGGQQYPVIVSGVRGSGYPIYIGIYAS